MTHKNIFLLSSVLLLISPSAFSCDDTSCETAYLSSTQQYVDLQNNHAAAAQRERIAYAKVRENRQKNINDQWIRETNTSLVHMINKAILNGESMTSVKRKLDAAYADGNLKSKPSSVQAFKNEPMQEEVKAPFWSFFKRVLHLND